MPSGDFDPQHKAPDVCPGCGRCRCCGAPVVLALPDPHGRGTGYFNPHVTETVSQGGGQ